MMRYSMPAGLTVRHAFYALLFVLVVVSAPPTAAESFDRGAAFTLARIQLQPPVDTNAGAQTLVSRWAFNGGGSVTGRAVVTMVSDADPDALYRGPPIVVAKLMPSSEWTNIEPIAAALVGEEPPSEVQLRDLLRATRRADCALAAVQSVYINTSLDAVTEWVWDVQFQGDYAVVVQQCTNTTLTLESNLVFLNPGGVHSSAEVVPLLNLYATVAILYLLTLICFVVNLWIHRGGRAPPRVLLLFVAVICFKTFAAALLGMRYLRLREQEDQTQQWFNTVSDFFNFCADIVLLLCILLLCTGYSVVRKKLIRREKQVIVLAVVTYTVFRLANFICGALSLDTSCTSIATSDTLCRFVCIAIAVVFVFRLRDVLLRRLSATYAVSLTSMRQGNAFEKCEPLTRFANIPTALTVQNFIGPFILYAIIPVFKLIVSGTVLSTQEELIETVIDEFSILYIFAIVGFYFTRLTPNSALKRRAINSAENL